jgi:hypothetical protein
MHFFVFKTLRIAIYLRKMLDGTIILMIFNYVVCMCWHI